jgi:hypothetical protein
MQTKFKWKDKQRLLMIAGLSMGVMLVHKIDAAHNLGGDIYVLANAKAEFINNDERIQNKLKVVFELQQTLGKGNIYEKMLELEKDEDEQTSFGA